MQVRNMKKVAVNAQVTFVVWILESIANLFVAIAWVFVYGKTSSFTLTNSMSWYYIILPYTFLMNTSYNKDRIVDGGWKAIFVNSVPASFNCNLFKRHQRIAQNTHDSKEQLSYLKRDIEDKQRTSPPGNKFFSSEGNQTHENKQLNVSVISARELIQSAAKYDSNHEEVELTPVQSTSGNYNKSSLSKTDRFSIG